MVFILGGIFWTGRESSHGLGALGEHWYCPLPLVATALGVAAVLVTQYVLRRPDTPAGE